MHTIQEAITALKNRQPIIVVDNENRENEGDLVYPAEVIDEQAIAFMLKYTSGIICLPLEGEILDHLDIPLMVETKSNSSRLGTNFTVSIEAKTGVTTGVSAKDRAHTIQVAIDPQSKAQDIAKPGHIFPLRAHPKGVLGRQGHTEAAIELAKLAGFKPAAVLCELMNEDGSMARLDEIEIFSEEHQIKVVSIDDLVDYVKS